MPGCGERGPGLILAADLSLGDCQHQGCQGQGEGDRHCDQLRNKGRQNSRGLVGSSSHGKMVKDEYASAAIASGPHPACCLVSFWWLWFGLFFVFLPLGILS